jgi:DNA polymerase (family X)
MNNKMNHKTMPMTVTNTEIADQFNQLADLLEIDNANPFRVRAYRNAAYTLINLSSEISELIQQGEDLTQLPGIGKDLAAKITTIVTTGKFTWLEEERQHPPPSLIELKQIPALGSKRIGILHEQLGIDTIEELSEAVKQQKIADLPGFGEKLQQNIARALPEFIGQEQRLRLNAATQYANAFVKYLASLKVVEQVIVAGSYRRRKDTVGDLDILVTARNDAKVTRHFVNHPQVATVVSHSDTRATIRLQSGLQIDLRVVSAESYGSALLYFTGAKAHNIHIRKLAQERGLKINEYGVFHDDKLIASASEREVYQQVGLPYIEPELRENRGEIEAAQQHRLPTLIRREDIQGDLHCHTRATDGHNTLAEMATAAQKLGYRYMAITDHSQHLTAANGMTAKRLRQQMAAIDELNEQFTDFQILKSSECDILEDGSLDLADDVLAELDLVVCAIHYKFDLSRAKQTERIIRAMDNPYVNILAHPTGRLINKRAAYAIDMEKIMRAAQERHCCLEINAQPRRLDLNDLHCKIAKELGIKFVISTDAHTTKDLSNMSYGIDQARRGWISKEDVINTHSLPELRKLLMRK